MYENILELHKTIKTEQRTR